MPRFYGAMEWKKEFNFDLERRIGAFRTILCWFANSVPYILIRTLNLNKMSLNRMTYEKVIKLDKNGKKTLNEYFLVENPLLDPY